MIRLTDEETTAAYYNAWNQEYEYQYAKKEEDTCHKLGREAVAKAQLKKVVEFMDYYEDSSEQHALEGHTRFDIPTERWQALLEEVKEWGVLFMNYGTMGVISKELCHSGQLKLPSVFKLIGDVYAGDSGLGMLS